MSDLFSTDPLSGEPQGPPPSSRPNTRAPPAGAFNFTPTPAPTAASASKASKRKRTNTEGSTTTGGSQIENMVVAALANTNSELLERIKELTSEVTALREQITRMEKAQNKGNNKVATIEKATKSFAQVAKENTPTQATPTATKATPQVAPANQKGKEDKRPSTPSKRMRRVVVLIEGAFSANALILRDQVNKALKSSNAPTEVMVLSIAFNAKGNAILTLREGCTSPQFLKFRQTVVDAFKGLKIKVKSVEADQQWFKYKLHGVPIEEFDGEKGMQKLKDEIESYNPKIKLAQTPRWLTSDDARKEKKFSTVVLAVQDQEECKVMKKGVWVSNKLCKTAEFVTSRPTDQCGQCLKTGHHWKQCTTTARCKICAGAHLSKDHLCKKCNKKGVSCGCSPVKCFNCGEGHMATYPRCVYILKSRGPQEKEKAPEKAATPSPENASAAAPAVASADAMDTTTV